MTLLLSRTDLEELLDPGACLDALRAGFLAPAGGVLPRRVRTGLPGPGTHALARTDAGTVAVIGAGAQPDLVITGLRRLRHVRELLVTDLDPALA